MTRWRVFACIIVLAAFAAGFLAGSAAPNVQAQQPGSRFERMSDEGPFRVWRDTRTDQCFIVTTPYYAMLDIGPC